MFEFKVIDADSLEWDSIVRSAEQYDFHHTSFYHKLDNSFPSYLLYFKKEESFIALPVVKRPIPETPYSDLTSAYGYTGPVFFFKNKDIKAELISFFKEQFLTYSEDNNIISVFSRLHPLFEQREILKDVGSIIDLNRTVSIDLKKPLEDQRRGYRKSLKSELNQLRKKGYIVSEAYNEKDINSFIDIYYQTMDRVSAASQYYFSREYFHNFLNNSSFDARLLLARSDNHIMAGAIFTYTGKIMQYHLAGTAEEYIRETPMKLILDEARFLGNELQAENLHLGGGVGGSDEDSLFKFKSAFSKNFAQYSVWQYIANKSVYNDLSKNKVNNSFFPLYRST